MVKCEICDKNIKNDDMINITLEFVPYKIHLSCKEEVAKRIDEERCYFCNEEIKVIFVASSEHCPSRTFKGY